MSSEGAEGESLVSEFDLRVDVYSNAVPGAKPTVRVTHIPSGLVAVNAETRSRLLNKAEAVAEIEQKLALAALAARRARDEIQVKCSRCPWTADVGIADVPTLPGYQDLQTGLPLVGWEDWGRVGRIGPCGAHAWEPRWESGE